MATLLIWQLEFPKLILGLHFMRRKQIRNSISALFIKYVHESAVTSIVNTKLTRTTKWFWMAFHLFHIVLFAEWARSRYLRLPQTFSGEQKSVKKTPEDDDKWNRMQSIDKRHHHPKKIGAPSCQSNSTHERMSQNEARKKRERAPRTNGKPTPKIYEHLMQRNYHFRNFNRLTHDREKYPADYYYYYFRSISFQCGAQRECREIKIAHRNNGGYLTSTIRCKVAFYPWFPLVHHVYTVVAVYHGCLRSVRVRVVGS